LLFYAFQANAETKKVVLATGDWEPYVSEAHPGRGTFAEIVTAVFREMGFEAVYVFAPWKRVEAIVKSGEAYAGIPYAYTEERHKTFDYSVPIMKASYEFFYNKKAYPNGISYSKLEDLGRYRIGGVIGYWYEGLFKQAALPIEYVTTDEQNITKLYFRRVDLAACDTLACWSLIKKLYPREFSDFAVVEKPFAVQQLHLMVSRNYPNAKEITQKFNATLKVMQEKKR
jgi:polar amino acid transport system substrate-binding protein